jgi:signal transduction histidine kinase
MLNFTAVGQFGGKRSITKGIRFIAVDRLADLSAQQCRVNRCATISKRMTSLNEFFAVNKELALFIYGLGFFILGFAIVLQVQQSSRLELARSLRWLAAFGITHAFNEWGELFIPFQMDHLPEVAVKLLFAMQLVLLAVSFALLFQFGISVLRPFTRQNWLNWVPLLLLLLWTLVSFFILFPLATDHRDWYRTVIALARYFIGFPGGLLAAYGLRYHALRRIKPLNVPAIFSNLQIAGILLGVYAFLGGFIPPPVGFFPGNLLNSKTFEQAIGIPVITFRTAISLIIAFYMIRSLEIFTLETQRKVEELEQGQIINAEQERLARELHDGAIQKVYTAGLLVESASRMAESTGELGTRLERAKVVLNDAIADLRHNLAELHHSEVLSAGESLEQWLRKLAEDPHYNTLVNISLDLNLPDEKALSPTRERHVFAIVSEAMSNIVRHANASNVNIQARDLGEKMRLLITDDGVGLTSKAKPGYGLRNMRDRSRLLNGELRFSEPASKGTTVTLEIPWMD